MPDIIFSIEAEDRGSQTVQKIDREVDQLGGSVDKLGREMDQTERKADALNRSFDTVALGAAGVAASVTAAVAGLAALTKQSAEYHREIEFISRATGRQQREIDASAKTFALYGVQLDQYSDAVRTFSDRLGDARFDQGSEIAEIFREIGLNIDDDNVKFEDFLGLLDRFDRSSRQFVIESIIGGEGARILEAFEDAGFQGQLQASLQLTIDPDDRQAILNADRQIERATQELGHSIDRLLAGNADLITGAINAVSSIFDNLPQFLRGDYFGIATGATTGSQPFVPQGPPAPSAAPANTGRRLQLAAAADPYNPSFTARAGSIAARNNRGVLPGGLSVVGPGLSLNDSLASLGILSDVGGFGGGRIQTLFGSMAGDLTDIAQQTRQFLPEIAGNTLGTLSAAAGFAALPGWGTLAALGVETVNLLGSIFDQGRERPTARRDDEASPEDDLFQFRNTGRLAPSPRYKIVDDLPDPIDSTGLAGLFDITAINFEDIKEVLELLGPIGPELREEFEKLESSAVDAWNKIIEETLDADERLKLFADFMNNEFNQGWDAFQLKVAGAWERFGHGLNLNAEQFRLLDDFIKNDFQTTIDDFQTKVTVAWSSIADSGGSAEDKLKAIEEYLKGDYSTAVLDMRNKMTGAFFAALTSSNAFYTKASLANANFVIEVETGFDDIASAELTLEQRLDQLIKKFEELFEAMAHGFHAVTLVLNSMILVFSNLANTVTYLSSKIDLLGSAINNLPTEKTISIDVETNYAAGPGSPGFNVKKYMDDTMIKAAMDARVFPDPNPPGPGDSTFNVKKYMDDAMIKAAMDARGGGGVFNNDPFGRGRGGGFADGGTFVANRPSIFLAGERGREVVQITPENANGGRGVDQGGEGTVNVNIYVNAIDAQGVRAFFQGEGRKQVEQIMKDASTRRGAVVSREGLFDDRLA